MPETLTDPHASATTPEGAAQEVADAEQLVEALEERVRNGDPDVTAEEIANARELSRFAQLRAEAARRRAAKEQEQARLDSLAALVDEIRAAASHRARLVAAVDTFDTALRDLIRLADGHNTALERWRRLATGYGIEPGSSEAGITVPRAKDTVRIDGETLAPVPLGSVINAVVHRATADDLSIRHEGQPLSARCPEWKDVNRKVIDLATALPAASAKADA